MFVTWYLDYNLIMSENIFGSRIKELRTQGGLTLQQLSERTGIHFSTLGHWETGIRDNASMKSLIVLAKYFDVSVDYLVGLKEY